MYVLRYVLAFTVSFALGACVSTDTSRRTSGRQHGKEITSSSSGEQTVREWVVTDEGSSLEKSTTVFEVPALPANAAVLGGVGVGGAVQSSILGLGTLLAGYAASRLRKLEKIEIEKRNERSLTLV